MRGWLWFIVIAIVSIGAVEGAARRDSMDPARCGKLVVLGLRCCAEGQTLRGESCSGTPARCPAPLAATEAGCAAENERITISGGILHAGGGDWEASGRVASGERTIGTFAIDSLEITEKDYGVCVRAGVCSPLPTSGEPGRAMGGMSRADAQAVCVFRGGRLPTHDEWTFAAAGSAARRYPWGDTGAVCRRGSWGLAEGPCDYGHGGPELAAIHVDGVSPEGVHDLAGNVSEWVAGDVDDLDGVVRGGSFATVLATDLRTWQAIRQPVASRSPEIGARCAYDIVGSAHLQVP